MLFRSVYAASFSRDGKFILTGGADKSARLWQVDRRTAIAPADHSQNWTTRLEELIQLIPGYPDHHGLDSHAARHDNLVTTGDFHPIELR